MNAHTTLAIELFDKIEKAKRRLAKLEREERLHLTLAPEEDRVEYFRVTEEIRKRYEEET